MEGLEYMGEHIRTTLKHCGNDVRLYPLCKIIRAQNASLYDNCQIFDFVFIDAGSSLQIGKYSTIAWQVIIEGGANTVIGNRVFIGPGSKILTSTLKINGFFTIEHLPAGCHEIAYGDIVIEDDAYVGASCTILPGVTIGKGAVVGANSLVTKNLEPWGIYVGSPAKKIGTREQPTAEKQVKIIDIDWPTLKTPFLEV